MKNVIACIYDLFWLKMKFQTLALKYISIIFLLLPTKFYSQEIPYLKNYDKSDYQAGQQNWSITQDDQDIMYFGNQEGLLRYNGTKWDLFTANYHKVIRSVCAFKDRIYSGAYGEFGFWVLGADGLMNYTSLTHLIPNVNFEREEVWNIVVYKERIYFQSFAMLFVYDGNQIRQISTQGNIMFLQIVNDKMIIPVIGKGLFELNQNQEMLFIEGSQKLGSDIVTAILPLNKDLLICTNDNGILYYKNGTLSAFDEKMNKLFYFHKINKALALNNYTYCFSTISNGIILYDINLKKYVVINKPKGLANNTVLCNFVDRDKGLWLGLDRGLAYVDIDNPFYYFKDEQGVLGTIYTAAKLKDKKYIGTNQGLYVWDADKEIYSPVSNIRGQVWQLFKSDDVVICGHNNGSHLITDHNIKKISDYNGGWHTIKIPNNDALLLQATYNGLIVFKKINTEYIFVHKIIGIDEPVERIVALDQYHFLIAGPNEGLKKIKLDPQFKAIVEIVKFDTSNGLPSDKDLELVKVNEQIFVKSSGKHYVFNYASQKFDFYSIGDYRMSSIGKFLTKIYKDSIVIYKSDNLKETYHIEILNEYGSVVEMDEREIIFCMDDGYFLSRNQSTNDNIKNTAKALVLDYILTRGGNRIRILNNATVAIPNLSNDFGIYFHQSVYDVEKQYRYRFVNKSNSWSNWVNDSKFEFQSLTHGNYEMEIASSNGQTANFKFEILAPWYVSRLMKFIYFIGFCFFTYLIKRQYEKEITRTKQKMEEENERAIREHKIELDNERLKQENLNKSLDLANTTLQLVKKNELLLEIKQEIVEIRKTNEVLTLKDFQKMVKSINDNVTMEDDNKLFEANFNEVHEVFFKKLLTKYSELTPQDLKLAAYLKMNLTSKEIAPLFNISIRGLENKRYRLRKKLDLHADENLTEFFLKME